MIAEIRPVEHICIVIDCRRTGKPRFPGRQFICAKHCGAASQKALNAHAAAAAALASCKPWRREHYAFLEASHWEGLRDEVVAACGLKPELIKKDQ